MTRCHYFVEHKLFLCKILFFWDVRQRQFDNLRRRFGTHIDFFVWYEQDPLWTRRRNNMGSGTSFDSIILTPANSSKTKFYLQNTAKASNQDFIIFT